MHEEGEKKNDRKGNSDEPEKRAFAKTHLSLLLQLREQRLRGAPVPARQLSRAHRFHETLKKHCLAFQDLGPCFRQAEPAGAVKLGKALLFS